MNRTPIEWCRTYAADGSYEEGFSVNPVRFRPHGSQRLVTMCQKVSPGCAHCYAEGITRRFWPKDAKRRVAHKFTMGTELVSIAFPGYTAQGIDEHSGEFLLDEKTLLSVLKRKNPARIFWGDMTDLFGEWVKDEWLDRMFAVCALTPHLTHIFLTKRPERMLAYLSNDYNYERWLRAADAPRAKYPRLCGIPISDPRRFPLPNVVLMVSAENQEQADKRIPLLLQTPAAKRGVSLEPLLGPIDFRRRCPEACQGECGYPSPFELLGAVLPGSPLIDWVIVGGLSGARTRPMHPDWVRRLRDQCIAAEVPFFFKQWGEFGAGSVSMSTGEEVFRQFDSFQQWVSKGDTWVNGGTCLDADGVILRTGGDLKRARFPVTIMHPRGKKVSGRMLDGREWNQFPGEAA